MNGLNFGINSNRGFISLVNEENVRKVDEEANIYGNDENSAVENLETNLDVDMVDHYENYNYEFSQYQKICKKSLEKLSKTYFQDATEFLLSFLEDKESFLKGKKIVTENMSSKEYANQIVKSLIKYTGIQMGVLNLQLLTEKVYTITLKWKKSTPVVNINPALVSKEKARKFIFSSSPVRLPRYNSIGYEEKEKHALFNLSVAFPDTRNALSLSNFIKARDRSFQGLSITLAISRLQKNTINDPVQNLPKMSMTHEQEIEALDIFCPVLMKSIKAENKKKSPQQSEVFHNYEFIEIKKKKLHKFSEIHS